MKQKPIKIGITGTHSTGKSTFLALLEETLKEHHLVVARINDLATRAKELGFPILTEHTYESTLWIMAEVMRLEAEASLTSDVILVDRPIIDALGYFEAALEVSGRRAEPRRLEELRTIAQAHATDYDLLVVTTLDHSIPLGAGRDQNSKFREEVARHIASLMSNITLNSLEMTSVNTPDLIKAATNLILTRRAANTDRN